MASLFDDEENVELLDKNATTSGAFTIKKRELLTDIKLEFDVKHPLYGLYFKRLQTFVEECQNVHVLKSSSGI